MFVAGFIGSPPMNLVRGVVSADGASMEHDGFKLRLPEPVPQLAGRDVVLGVRPEEVTVVEQGGLGNFRCETVEALGADHLIHGKLLGQMVVFREPNGKWLPEAGVDAGMTFEAKAVHWFDPATTKRIRL